MNKQNPQQPSPDVSAWLAQMSDPKFWTALQSQFQSQFAPFKPPAQAFPGFAAMGAPPAGSQVDPTAFLKQLADNGATIDPAELVRLQQDYTQQFGALWQSMLAAKTPAITDRRLSAPAWQEHPYFAFQLPPTSSIPASCWPWPMQCRVARRCATSCVLQCSR